MRVVVLYVKILGWKKMPTIWITLDSPSGDPSLKAWRFEHKMKFANGFCQLTFRKTLTMTICRASSVGLARQAIGRNTLPGNALARLPRADALAPRISWYGRTGFATATLIRIPSSLKNSLLRQNRSPAETGYRNRPSIRCG